MGDTDNIIGAANARNLIINFFMYNENKEKLFNEIIDILKNEDDFFYIYNDSEKFEMFHDCIIDGHFKWIFAVTDNQIQTEFDSKYTNECLANNKIFHDFYKIFDTIILDSNDFSKRAKGLLHKYSKFLTE